MKKHLIFIVLGCLLSGILSLVFGQDYLIKPVPFTSVKVDDDFWSQRIERNHQVTIPIALNQCYSTGRVDNFLFAAKIKEGEFCTEYPFDDTDIYKILEGASYTLQTFPDKALEARMDTLIEYITKAQEPDGYLYTNRTINPEKTHAWAGSTRWEKTPELSHELYNSGHLFEAAVAHFQATGKRSLLDVAIKNADLLVNTFGPGKLDYEPGHQIVEMGLVKMYRATGKKEYLDLAKFFLDVRGGGSTYSQNHKKVVEQTEAVGHSVRATYMYSGMADVAALTGDSAYIKAIDAIWEDIVYKKYYITGGIGAAGGHEGFGPAYELPNMSAYNETCAAIGNVYWNWRLFLLHGESKYYDVLERTLYNGMISGISLKGDRFFYPNPLESMGQHARSKWFGCACCPSNVTRFIASVPGYIYAIKDNRLYVNLYIKSTSHMDVNGCAVELIQDNEYPWSGELQFKVNPAKKSKFEIALRIPGWARNEPVPSDLYQYKTKTSEDFDLTVNGRPVKYQMQDGYAVISKKWKKGDKIILRLNMPVRRIKANEKVVADQSRVALQRGPLVYCVEWPDFEDKKVLDLLLLPTASLSSKYEPELLDGIQAIYGSAKKLKCSATGEISQVNAKLTAIPYYAWANRGKGEMAVWIAEKPEVVHVRRPTIAANSKVEASHMRGSIVAVNDQYEPANSNDNNVIRYHWWPKRDEMQWVQYIFEKPEKVSSAKVYWFDDGPHGGCRVPASWKVLYQTENGEWQEVTAKSEYGVAKDRFNTVDFEEVTTGSLKLEVQLSKEFSSGILEWIVE